MASKKDSQASDPFSQSNGHFVSDAKGSLVASTEAGPNTSTRVFVPYAPAAR